MEVHFAAAGDVVTGGAEGVVEGRLIERIILGIALDATTGVLAAGGEAGTGGCAQGGGDDAAAEADSRFGDRVEEGGSDAEARRGARPVVTVLVGKEK